MEGGVRMRWMLRRMLIADDDMHLRKLVSTYAELEGFQCQEAENAQEAIDLLEKTDFDILILDIMMPGKDGFEALAEILLGFNLGADDYVSKPFSPKELMARVNAVLKRTGSAPNMILQFGDLRIQIDARLVEIGEKTINLPPKEFDLLVKLAQNEHIVLTREQLLETVWGYEYHGDTRTVDSHVKSLREHLGEYRKLIQTVWGVGYKFEYRE